MPTQIDIEINTVIDLLRKYSLTGSEQVTIENAIGLIASQYNWTRQRSAWYLHHRAFPEVY